MTSFLDDVVLQNGPREESVPSLSFQGEPPVTREAKLKMAELLPLKYTSIFNSIFSTFWGILFVGVRTLTAGEPVLDYTGPNGYK